MWHRQSDRPRDRLAPISRTARADKTISRPDTNLGKKLGTAHNMDRECIARGLFAANGKTGSIAPE